MILPKSVCAGPAGRLAARLISTIIPAGLLAISPEIQAGDDQSAAFVLRNYSPFTAIIGPPGRWPQQNGAPFELSWNIANHSEIDAAGGEDLLLDGETHTVTARYQHRLGERLMFGIQVPWTSHSGGFLDGVIDSWHDLTGLSEGSRPNRPSDELEYVYGQNGEELFRLDDDASGLADISIGLAANLGTLPGGVPWFVTLNADLPTGDADDLTGNGNADLAAGLRLTSPPAGSGPVSWWIDLGLVWPGDVDIDGLEPSDQIFYYDAAVAWHALSRLDVLIQLAGTSAPYDSRIKMLGDPSMQIAGGLVWHVANRVGLRLGFTEDIRVNTAPDFGLELSVIVKR